jgi:hypothetical protein
MSSSLSIRVTNAEASVTSLNAKTGSYATTGSNTFTGTQTVQGTIIAQTLNVQQVTSSIVYSSGSNIFGKLVTDVQSMTGSLRVTGSGDHWVMGGSVGIGTITPGVKLDVVGDLGVDNYIRVIGGQGATKGGLLIGNNDGTKTYGGLYFDNSNNNVILNQRYATGYLGLGTNSRTSDLIIANDGNVGIGTTSPQAKLDVGFTSWNNTNKPLIVRNTALPINTAVYDTVVIQQDDVTTLRLVEKNTGGSPDQVMTFSIGDGNGRISTSAQPLQFYVNGTSGSTGYTGLGGTLAMNIDTNGKVGINTSSNAAQFYIYNNNTYSAANLNETTSSAMAFRIRSRAGSNVNIVMGAFDSTQAGLQALDSSTAAAIGFLLNPYGGNIGIGTTSPSSLLHTYASGDNIIRVQTIGNSTAANYFMTNVSGTAKRYYAGVNISSAGGAYEIYDDTAGASRLFIKTDGNIGISTTSPGAKLDVWGILRVTGSATTLATFESSGANAFIGLKDSSGDFVYLGNDDGDFLVQTPTSAYSTKLIVKDDGNVGIGTTAPADTLSYGRALDIQSSTGAAIYLRDSDATSVYGFLSYDGSVGRTNLGAIGASNYLRFVSAGSEAMRIDTNGNVVIGSTVANPVASTSKAALTLRKFTSGNASTVISASYYIGVGGNEYTNGSYRLIGFGYAEESAVTTYPSYIGYIERTTSGYTYGDLIFGTRATTGASDNPIERMRIQNNGCIGIGTTSATAAVHISGDGIAANQLRLNNNGTGTNGFLDFNVISTRATITTNYSSDNIPLELKSFGNNNQIFLATNGNVGVGTSNPQTELHIAGISGWAELRLAGSTAGSGGSLEFYSGSVQLGDIYMGSSKDLTFRVNGASTVMYIKSDGNVGIGTTNPQIKLDIGYDVNNRSLVRLSSNAANRMAAVRFDGNNIESGYIGYEGGSEIVSGGVQGDLIIRNMLSGKDIILDVNAGSVGIGTTSPSEKLEVSGTSNIYGRITSTNGANAGIRFNSSGIKEYGIFSDGALRFYDFTAATERMRIDTNGNVGISTTSPSALLHVQGLAASPNADSVYITNKRGGYFPLRILVTQGDYQGVLIEHQDGDGSGGPGGFGTYGFKFDDKRISGTYTAHPSASFVIARSNTYNNTNIFEVRPYNTTAAIAVATGGNVGIGTATPNSPLHVWKDAGDGNSVVRFRNSNSTFRTTTLQFEDYAGAYADGLISFNVKSGAAVGSYLGMGISTTGSLVIAYGGNIGIGTVNPAGKFEIKSSAQTYATSPSITFTDNAGVTDSRWILGNIATSWGAFNLAVAESATSTNYTPVLTAISGSNYIGIGTTAPGYKLDVKGTGYFDGPLYVGTTSNRNYFSRGDIRLTDASSNVYVLDISVSSTSGYISTNYYGGGANMPLVLQSYGNNNQLYLATSGNVGINTTAPTEKLQVDGYILNRSKLGFVQRHDIVKNGLTFYVDFNNKNCWDPVVDGTPSGTSVKDLSNNKYLVAFSGTATVAAKDGNYGLYGNGAGNYMAVKDYTLSSLPHTWEAWVLADGLSGYDTFWDSGTERPLFGALSANPIFYPDAPVSGVTLSTGKWYHFVVAMASNNTYQFYMNGRQISSVTYGSVIRTGTFDMWLGGDTSSESWNGYIPIARMYNRQLSATEVMQNYNAEKWRFDNNSTFYHDVATGNVGIGTTNPAYLLDVSGTIRATGDVIAYSDARVKDNVTTVENALDKVKSLRGVTYTRKDDDTKTPKVGVIAQEVLPILPEVVQQDTNGNYSVAYGNMVGVLIEAIKEQQRQIDELKYLLQNK